MKKSTLRKKSPVFRQGHRTGYQDGIAGTIKTTEDKFADVMESIESRSMTDREREIADINFVGGKKIGYHEGFAACSDQREREKTDLTLAGVVVIAMIAGAIGLAVGGVL